MQLLSKPSRLGCQKKAFGAVPSDAVDTGES